MSTPRGAPADSPAGGSSWLTELLTSNCAAQSYSPFVDRFCLCFWQPFRYVRLAHSEARPMVRLGFASTPRGLPARGPRWWSVRA